MVNPCKAAPDAAEPEKSFPPTALCLHAACHEYVLLITQDCTILQTSTVPPPLGSESKWIQGPAGDLPQRREGHVVLEVR